MASWLLLVELRSDDVDPDGAAKEVEALADALAQRGLEARADSIAHLVWEYDVMVVVDGDRDAMDAFIDAPSVLKRRRAVPLEREAGALGEAIGKWRLGVAGRA